jgi:rRNA maturation protein Nop10
VRSGLYGGCSNGVPPIHFFQAEHRIQFRSRSMRFLGFSNLETGALRQEISKTVCSTFSRNGWSVVRSASLAKGGTSKKRPSPHLHEVPTRSNKVSPQTFQTALVCLHTLTSTLDGDKRSASRPRRFTPEQVWTRWRREKKTVSAENRTPAVQRKA